MISNVVQWLFISLSVAFCTQPGKDTVLHETGSISIRESIEAPILDPYHIECRGNTLLISDMKTGRIHVADRNTGQVFRVLQPSLESLIDSIRPQLAGRYDSVVFYSLDEYAMMTRQTKEDLMAFPMNRPKYFVGRFLNDGIVDVLTGCYIPAFRGGTVPLMWTVVSIVRYSLRDMKVVSIRPLMGRDMTSWPQTDAFLPLDDGAIVGVEDSRAMRAGLQAEIPLMARFDSRGEHSIEHVPIDEQQVSTLGYGLTMTQPIKLQNGSILYTYAAVPRCVVFTKKLSDYRSISFDEVVRNIPDGQGLLDSLQQLQIGGGQNNAGKNPYVCTGFVPIDNDHYAAVVRDWRTKKGDTVTSYIVVGSLEENAIAFRSITRFDTLNYQPWRAFTITDRDDKGQLGVIGRNAERGDWVVRTYRIGAKR